MGSKSVVVRLSQKDLMFVEQFARDNAISMSDVMRMALREFMRKHEVKS